MTAPDTIGDFVTGQDKIELSHDTFSASASGQLDALTFSEGPVAEAPTDRILFNTATGELSYDADGSGDGSAIIFARLVGGAVIAASDIFVTF